MSISKSEARRLAKNATEMGAQIVRGNVEVGVQGVTLGGRDILDWLNQYAGQEIILVAATIDKAKTWQDIDQTCQRCGRDYQGERCEYCAAARARLRGT